MCVCYVVFSKHYVAFGKHSYNIQCVCVPMAMPDHPQSSPGIPPMGGSTLDRAGEGGRTSFLDPPPCTQNFRPNGIDGIKHTNDTTRTTPIDTHIATNSIYGVLG